MIKLSIMGGTAPGRRVIENKHSSQDRRMTSLHGECAYIRVQEAEEEEDEEDDDEEERRRRRRRFNVGRVHDLNMRPTEALEQRGVLGERVRPLLPDRRHAQAVEVPGRRVTENENSTEIGA